MYLREFKWSRARVKIRHSSRPAIAPSPTRGYIETTSRRTEVLKAKSKEQRAKGQEPRANLSWLLPLCAQANRGQKAKGEEPFAISCPASSNTDLRAIFNNCLNSR